MLSILSLVLAFFDKVFGYVGQIDKDRTSVDIAQIAAEQTSIQAMPYAAWTWKAVLWDKIVMQGHSTTDPLTGSLGTAYWIIISGLFLHALSNK